MQYRRLIAKAVTWPVICTILVTVCCSGCLGPSTRTLTFEEERQLQKEEAYTYSLPRDQQGLAQRQVECNREILEDKDWHTGDILLDAASDKKSKCEPFRKATQSDVANDNHGAATDAVIDKNLKDALDKSQK